jgi:hypothetical protein
MAEAQMAAALQQLNGQVQQLRAQVQAQPAPGLKPAKPTTFSAAGRDRRQLEDWLFSVDNYFAILGDQQPDAQRVAFMGGLLTGDARKWYRTHAQQLAQQGADYNAFKAAFRAAFAPVNTASNARTALDALRQTGSVQGYNAAFRALLLDVPDMGAADALHRYVTGLKDHIQRQVQIHNPATLDDAMATADRIDSVRPAPSAPPRHNRGHQRRVFFPPAPAAQAPVPMDLGVMRAANGRFRAAGSAPPPQQQRTRLTPEERAHLLANNGCVYCRRLGHNVNQCPQRPRNLGNAATPSLQQGNGFRRRQ